MWLPSQLLQAFSIAIVYFSVFQLTKQIPGGSSSFWSSSSPEGYHRCPPPAKSLFVEENWSHSRGFRLPTPRSSGGSEKVSFLIFWFNVYMDEINVCSVQISHRVFPCPPFEGEQGEICFLYFCLMCTWIKLLLKEGREKRRKKREKRKRKKKLTASSPVLLLKEGREEMPRSSSSLI